MAEHRRLLSLLRHPITTTCLALLICGGCESDMDRIREIQMRRESSVGVQTQQDYLGEVTNLVSRFVELNSETARRQVGYQLNQWRQSQGSSAEPTTATELIQTLASVVPATVLAEQVNRPDYTNLDVDYLRDSYLFNQVVRWVDAEGEVDPLLQDWFDGLAGRLDVNSLARLKTASRLFDWTVRNIALEPMTLAPPVDQLPIPPLPLGMQFEGPGYRQSDYETLWRGTGDAYQRAGVFTQLCRQANVPAAVLATQSSETGSLTPWAVGVLVGEQIYLFEPALGIFVPGPDQVGIATLSDARRDDAVMRRLSIAGLFDYPLTQQDVQQSVALLNVMTEAISPRMRRLEQSLTGDRRMTLFVDADRLATQFDNVAGIAGVRLWSVPLLAEVYRATMEQAAERDQLFNFWYRSRWAFLEFDVASAQSLAQGRWRHLQGRFADNEIENEPGARTLYLEQRAPEFEIADLRIDVELQQHYNIRRELGVDPRVYDQQVVRIQAMMRLGKRTATYWLSLIQYDDRRFETAWNWFDKRVLDPEQRSLWEPAARYNLGRTAEQLGKWETAIETYKTAGDPQEHGNRIRARLIGREQEEG